MILSKGKKGWYYLSVKKISILLEKRSKHHGGFYYLNCLHSFKKEKKSKSHEKIFFLEKYFCGIVMPSEKSNLINI